MKSISLSGGDHKSLQKKIAKSKNTTNQIIADYDKNVIVSYVPTNEIICSKSGFDKQKFHDECEESLKELNKLKFETQELVIHGQIKPETKEKYSNLLTNLNNCIASLEEVKPPSK